MIFRARRASKGRRVQYNRLAPLLGLRAALFIQGRNRLTGAAPYLVPAVADAPVRYFKRFTQCARQRLHAVAGLEVRFVLVQVQHPDHATRA